MTLPQNNPVTQIFYLTIPKEKDLKSDSAWAKALDLLERSPGFQRCYYGRSPEVPEKVQLHVGMFVHSLPDPSTPPHQKRILTYQP
jgi:hypothetical protein